MEGDPFDLVGDVLDGQFRVIELAGEGSLSVVYRGHHLGVDATVAIKCLNLPQTLDAALVRPLVESFRQASKVHYRLARGNLNIAQAIASGSTLVPRTGTTVPYLVREWFDGESLAAELGRRRAGGSHGRPVEEVLALLEPAMDGVAYAHAQGVVHSALNPSNVFVARHGERRALKVLDFGVARTMNQIASELPAGARSEGEGLHLLFPAYAAPEQLDKGVGDVGPPTDVYTLALVVMELLSDRPVMTGDTPALVARALDERHRPTPRAHDLRLPRNLEIVLTRAVSLAPSQRQKNAGDLWRDIKSAVRPTASRPLASAMAPRVAQPTLAGIAPAPAVVGAVPGRRLVVGATAGTGTVPMSFEPAAGPSSAPASVARASVAPAPAAPPLRPVSAPAPPQLAPPTPPPPAVAPNTALPPVIVAEPTPPLPVAALVPPPAPAPAEIALPPPVLAVNRPAWPTGPQAPTYPILNDEAPPRPRRIVLMVVSLGVLALGLAVVVLAVASARLRAAPTPAASSSPAASSPAAPPAPPSASAAEARGASPSTSASAPASHDEAPTEKFSATKARRALDKTWKHVARCRKGHAWGVAVATVTFDGDGSVSDVVVGWPFRNTPTATCVAEEMSAAHMTPFVGGPKAVKYRFYVSPR